MEAALEHFNGKCLVSFTYRRENGAWRLDQKIDGRVMQELSREFSKMLYVDLPRVEDKRQLPFVHEGLLLEILRNAKLDEGPMHKKMGGAYGEDGQVYSITVEIKRRRERVRPGLANH